jgi:hypothetical protein
MMMPSFVRNQNFIQEIDVDTGYTLDYHKYYELNLQSGQWFFDQLDNLNLQTSSPYYVKI